MKSKSLDRWGLGLLVTVGLDPRPVSAPDDAADASTRAPAG
jgi:hypothetical protein